jgi:hypothetical protein
MNFEISSEAHDERNTTDHQHGAERVLSRCWDVARNAATIAGMKRTTLQHSASANDAISYAGYRFPPDVISYAVWLYFRFPLSLRMVEEYWQLAALTLPTKRCAAGR